MAQSGASENKDQLLEKLLQGLKDDRIGVLDEFAEYQGSKAPFFEKVEIAHEFLDLLTFKIKESKSRMNKEQLSQYSLGFLRQTIRQYGYNPKFVATQGYDLRTLLRGGASDEAIASAIAPIWQQRTDRYSELRSSLPADAGGGARRVEMSYIGG